MPSASDAVSAPSLEEGAAPPAIEVRGVTHRYDPKSAAAALGPVDLVVTPGEFVVVVGASGCGKSTLLRLVAGFETASEGSVLVHGDEPRPGRAGLVFQQPRLFPWRTVGGNIDLALATASVPAEQRTARREDLLSQVGLREVSQRRTWQLSGGQQQRVAIARALAVPSDLLLLDEPFAALDALTRERLQEDLRASSTRTGGTSVFVTHSVDEAVFLGTRIIVLTSAPGRIALDVPVPLPREGADPAEVRGLPEFAALRAEVGAHLRSVAA